MIDGRGDGGGDGGGDGDGELMMMYYPAAV